MDQDHPSNTPSNKLDALLSRPEQCHLRLAHEVDPDTAFLARLVNTARAAQPDAAFTAQMITRIRRAPGSGSTSQPRRPVPSVRQVALSVSSAFVVLAFFTLSLFTWSATGQHAQAATFAPAVADTIGAATPVERSVPSSATATRLPASTAMNTQLRGRATLIMMAPSPADTPLPRATGTDGLPVIPEEH